MPLQDPVSIYNAANYLKAPFVRDALIAGGAEAFVIEDVSQVGTWVGGLVPEIHKPQVWVERADIERAQPVLDHFEERAARLQDSSAADPAAGQTVEAVREECNGRSSFPASQRGSVQQCLHCGAYLDVGDEELPEGWEEVGAEEEAEESRDRSE
jgi:hypothetical protein